MEKDIIIKRLEKKNKILTALLIVVLIIVLSIAALYLRRSYIKETGFKRAVDKYTNLIDTNFTKNLTYDENKHNSNGKLKLISSYGDNQPTHPKVLNFKDKWHGYKYWITYSPYPKGNDKYENPHIAVSNDKINWKEPVGIKNPIEDTPKNYKPGVIYNSDPHILYNYDKDMLELYYRYVNDEKDEVIIYRNTSSDGINWSKKEEIIKAKRSEKDYLSPAILYDNGTYKFWYVDKDLKVKYEESKDGYKYEGLKEIKLEYPNEINTSWHLDVIKTDKGYEMITVAFKNWNDRKFMNLYYFKSKDNVNYEKGKIIIRPSLISWDNQGLYRSTFMYDEGKYYVYYSAIRTDGERGIGLSYGENIENLIGSNF